MEEESLRLTESNWYSVISVSVSRNLKVRSLDPVPQWCLVRDVVIDNTYAPLPLNLQNAEYPVRSRVATVNRFKIASSIPLLSSSDLHSII